MPRTINDVDVLQQYICGVMERAKHHAGDVEEIALAVAGAIVWRKTEPIRVFEREGEMANALWLRVGTHQYALSYNHVAGVIEVREENMRGQVLASFSNATPITDLKRFFEQL